jgi:glycerol-3-phosphate dehydrogenase (NAD(P)+)
MTEREFRPCVGFVGAGRFGLALAQIVAENGHKALLYTTLPDRAAELRETRRCPDVIPELKQLHPDVRITEDARELAAQSTLIIFTVGAAYLELVLGPVGAVLDGAHQVVHAVHRLEGDSLLRTSQVLRQRSCVKQMGVIAGPTHVSELLSDRPNAAVVGSAFPEIIRGVQRVFARGNLRVYGNTDLRGVELAAALGQVVALAVGLSDGLGLGAATHATLMTRGLAEIARIGTELGATERTFAGLAGVGRLVDAVRRGEPNYQLGLDLATSVDVVATIEQASVEAQGVAVVQHVNAYAERHHLDLPICSALGRVFDATWTAEDAMRSLMSIDQMYE